MGASPIIQLKSAAYNSLLNKSPFFPRTIFPLSEINSKQEVRDIALNNNLPSFEKSDSQDICFIPNNDYCNFLENIKTKTEQIKNITSGDFIFNLSASFII